MYPNDPFQTQPTGIDYLNQISAPPPAQGFDKKTKLIMIILGLVGALSLIFIFIMASRTTDGPTPIKVAARLQTMQTISDKFKDKLRTSRLQDANSSLGAVLTTANKSIEKPLASVGVDVKKQAKEITALAKNTELEQRLDDAFLSYGSLDTTYVREMSVQIETAIGDMNRLRKTTRNASLKEFLEKTTADLTNIKQQLTTL